MLHHMVELLPYNLSTVEASLSFKLHTILRKLRHLRAADHLLLLSTWGTFFAAACVAFFLELRAERQELSLRTFFCFCFPGEEWKRHSPRTDVLLYFVGRVIHPFFGVGGFLITTFLVHAISQILVAAGFPRSGTNGGVSVAIALGFLFFLANDFANYLTHLAEHKLPLLWEFHKVHHTATFLSPLTTAREHPLVKVFDALVSGTFVGLVIGVAKAYYGFSLLEMMGLLSTANMFGNLIVLESLKHSQFPISFGVFDKVLISPHMHQLHHSLKEAHWNRNMGSKLAIWDVFFKTHSVPSRGEALKYGSGDATDDHEFRSALRCYFLPFLKIYRVWKTSRVRSQKDKS